MVDRMDGVGTALTLFGIGEVFALACAFIWASSIVLFKYAGNSMSANTLNLFKNSVGLLLLIPTAIMIEGFTLPALNLQAWAIVLLTGYFGIAIADTLYFQALRSIGASRTAIVGSLYSPFVVLLSMLFLNETLKLWQWLGFILVLLGILVVVYQRHAKQLDSRVLLLGVICACGSVFLTAAGVVAMKPILSVPENEMNFFWLVTLRMLAGVGGTLVFLILSKQLANTLSVITQRQHNWPVVLLASILSSYLAMMLWLAGFKYADASVASVLNETASVIIVLMAALFLGESLTKRKLIGMVLTFLGVLIFLGVFSF